MTDFALPAVRTLDLTSDAAKARVRARYRAEARFKFYGLAAIGLTAIFLVVVLSDIVVRGYPGVLAAQASCSTSRSTAPRSIRRGRAIRPLSAPATSTPLVRNALRAQFPDVSDRAGRRLLDGILSSGASDALRERVVADPSLVGQTVKVPVLMSDDADLYYKGIGTRIERRPGRGILTPSGTTDEIVLLSSSNDFASDVTTVKQALSVQARATCARTPTLCARSSASIEARKAELERGLALAPASTSLQRDLANLTGEIEDPVAKGEGARRAGGGPAGSLRRRRRGDAWTTRFRACWSRSTAVWSRSPSSATPKPPAPCCCRWNRPRTPIPEAGKS